MMFAVPRLCAPSSGSSSAAEGTCPRGVRPLISSDAMTADLAGRIFDGRPVPHPCGARRNVGGRNGRDARLPVTGRSLPHRWPAGDGHPRREADAGEMGEIWCEAPAS